MPGYLSSTSLTTPKRPLSDAVGVFPYAGSLAIPLNAPIFIADAVHSSLSAAKAYPASSLYASGIAAGAQAEALQQREFALRFAGFSLDEKLSTDPAGTLSVARFGVMEMDLDAATTLAIGDLIGIHVPSTTASNILVEKVDCPSKAIGEVVEYGTSLTQAVFRFDGRFGSGRRAGFNTDGLLRGFVTAATSGTQVLYRGSAPVMLIDPNGGAITVDMPAEATSKGLTFVIRNTADAAEAIAVEDSASAALVPAVSIAQSESAILYCDGTVWRAVVAASHI